ncbi:MAG: RNA polymerase factor sigma-54 [Paracoccaceae bacterium]
MQGLRLELRQSQSLVMTPQLRQAIKLLQMGHLDLAAHVAELAEANPLLAVDDGTGDAPTPAAEKDAAPGEDPAAAAATFDAEARANLYDAPPREAPALPFGHAEAGGAGYAPGEDAAGAPSLREALARQIEAMRAAPLARVAALAVVEALEDDGYLREPIEALAARLGLERATALDGLALVQACEPTGVAARDLAECLALQLAEADRLDPMMRRFLDNLALVAKGDRRRLCLACEATAEDVADMLAEIRRLDPRPGLAFAPALAPTRVADVLLARGPRGGWDIALNPETLPRVAVDHRYTLSLDAAGRESDRWIADKRAEAQWLVRSIAKRAETVLTVVREIVRAQEAFFDRGASGLRPLTLRRIAETTGLHESTVSRVAANKLIATPRGLFELKFFFCNGVGEDGALSAETVRQRLGALVAAEPADAVLSDDDLVAALNREGMHVARRTVAKYRKTLGLPSSVERRRLKALA